MLKVYIPMIGFLTLFLMVVLSIWFFEERQLLSSSHAQNVYCHSLLISDIVANNNSGNLVVHQDKTS